LRKTNVFLLSNVLIRDREKKTEKTQDQRQKTKRTKMVEKI